MSKVDLTVFEELLEEESVAEDKDLSEVIYHLASGGFGEIVDYTGNWDSHKELSDALETKYGYEHLEQEGGGAEHCYGVFKLKDKVYKAEYSYYSYHGDNYDDIESTLREVTPVQKTITVWQQL